MRIWFVALACLCALSDCRVNAVEYDGRTHVATCPDGEASSFLRAIREAIDADRSEL